MEPSGVDHAALYEWVDSARITRVIQMYFQALDEKHFNESHFRQIVTSDAKVIRPNGAAVVGTKNIADSHARSFARFEATQHLFTDPHIDIDGDTAAVRANLVAIHVWKDHPVEEDMRDRAFTAGGVITVALTRAPDGWRITQTENRVIWRTGYFGDMLQFSYGAPPPA